MANQLTCTALIFMQIHKSNLVHIFLSITFSAFLILYSTTASAFCTKTYEADIDVTLIDSRIIKVTRKVCWTFQLVSGDEAGMKLFASWPDKYWIKFQHPDTHEKIEWEGDQYFDPLLLDFVKGVPYLVVGGRPDKDTSAKYGCPELPFIFLKYEKTGIWGKWIPIPVEQAPAELKYVNLPENEHTQGIIPRSYDEWNYAYKNSYRNERRRGDCRPPLQPLPDVALPKPEDVDLETVESTVYIVKSSDEYYKSLSERKGTLTRARCATLFRPPNPENLMLGERFVKDPTGSKRLPYSGLSPLPLRMLETRTERYCDDQFVWFIAGHEELGKTIITKYSTTGDFLYNIRITNPKNADGQFEQMVLDSPTIANNFFYFYWVQDVKRPDGQFLEYPHRMLKLRFREPAHETPVTTSLIVAPTSSTGSGIKGMWSIDTKATESFVKSSPPPPLDVSWLAKWFTLSAKNLAVRTYEFSGNAAIASENDAGRKVEFQLTSQQGTEIQYSPKTVSNGPAKSLKVSLLKDGNITIVPSWEPEMAYVLWRRGSSKKEQFLPDDLMTAWVASIKNIALFLYALPKGSLEPPSPIEKEGPQSALAAAIRNGAIRRATSVDAHAWLDADIEKYKRKNLSPPDDLDETFILGSWIYKANAYVVLKKFTYPAGLIDNNVAIFLIPRDVPVPDGDYGHSKIYHLYDDYFKGPSVEYSAGSSWAKGQWIIQQQ